MTDALAATAFHEAGHVVVLHLLGIAFTRVTIQPQGMQGGSAQEVRYSPTPDAFRRAIRATEAGMIAQFEAYPRETRKVHAFSDQHITSQLLVRLAELEEGVDCDSELSAAHEDARALVRQNWSAIEAIAASLLEHGELTSDAVRKIVTESA